jgi:hypothetical protein
LIESNGVGIQVERTRNITILNYWFQGNGAAIAGVQLNWMTAQEAQVEIVCPKGLCFTLAFVIAAASSASSTPSKEQNNKKNNYHRYITR